MVGRVWGGRLRRACASSIFGQFAFLRKFASSEETSAGVFCF
jgi:hypothetical protein